MKITAPVFTTLLIVTTFFVIITTNSIFAWIIIELNILTFIPLICLQNSNSEADTSINYLIPQSFASSLFIISIIITTFSPYSNVLASTALLINAGSVPLHSWFPIVMHSINTTAGFILITWQNIVPLFLLSIPQLSFTPFILTSAVISALWGSVAGLNQTNIILLLTFSSIAHLSWLILASFLSVNALFMYLTSYLLTLLPILSSIDTPNINTHNIIICGEGKNYPRIVFLLNILSLAGLPPLAIFSNKILIITLINEILLILTLILISTAISLYFYIVVIFTTILNLSEPLELSYNNALSNNFYTLSIVFQFSVFPLILYSLL